MVYSSKWNPLIECISPLRTALLHYNLWLGYADTTALSPKGPAFTGLYKIYADDINCCITRVKFSEPC